MNNNSMMNNKTRFNVGYAIAAIFAIFVIQYFISTVSQIAIVPLQRISATTEAGEG